MRATDRRLFVRLSAVVTMPPAAEGGVALFEGDVASHGGPHHQGVEGGPPLWVGEDGKGHLVSGVPGEFWHLGSAKSFKFSARIPAGVEIELFWE